jgi:hypothetical protein
LSLEGTSICRRFKMNRKTVKVTMAASLIGIVGVAAVDEKYIAFDQPHVHAEGPVEPAIGVVEIAAPVTHPVSSSAGIPFESLRRIN